MTVEGELDAVHRHRGSEVTGVDLDVDRIARAAHTVDPVFRDSPQFVDEQLCAALGREVLVKVETLNPLHSFKGRGAEWFADQLEPGRRVVCASSGNFGQAMAYACRRRAIPVEVFVPADVNPVKAARMRALGAEVRVTDGDGDLAEDAARAWSQGSGDARFVADGDEPAIAEGAGTIGVELLRSGPFDAVVVPVGDGALINGIACWVKHHAPATRVIGVCAEGAPSMVHSWRAGRPVPTERADTIAEGIAIRSPVPRSLERMRALVDDLVLVPDSALIDMMRLSAETLGILLEPSGAAGLAAIATRDLPGERLATVLTGSNPRHQLLAALLTGDRP
jgi:threonine dehydratase